MVDRLPNGSIEWLTLAIRFSDLDVAFLLLPSPIPRQSNVVRGPHSSDSFPMCLLVLLGDSRFISE